jgi:chemotaxis protein MotB
MEPNMKHNQVKRGRDHYRKMIAASQESDDTDHNWLITLSDLLSLLLVFFIIFFAISRVSGSKNPVSPREANATVRPAAASPRPSPPVRLESEKMEKVRKDMLAAVTALNLNDQVKVEAANREIIITMKENVTFRTGEVDILKESHPVLDAIAQTVKKNPTFMVDIDGHTDDQPISTSRFPSNWDLSVARATSVLKYLMTHYELDPARFTIKGNADQRPLVPNWNTENRALNRRVEIRLKEESPAGA